VEVSVGGVVKGGLRAVPKIVSKDGVIKYTDRIKGGLPETMALFIIYPQK
jgi:hypothetical protein